MEAPQILLFSGERSLRYVVRPNPPPPPPRMPNVARGKRKTESFRNRWYFQKFGKADVFSRQHVFHCRDLSFCSRSFLPVRPASSSLAQSSNVCRGSVPKVAHKVTHGASYESLSRKPSTKVFRESAQVFHESLPRKSSTKVFHEGPF